MADSGYGEYFIDLSADKIESRLIGAVTWNEALDLTDEQKAVARENIGAGKSDSGVIIRGYFESIQEMMDALQTLPASGDAYGIDEFFDRFQENISTVAEQADYSLGASPTTVKVVEIATGTVLTPGDDYTYSNGVITLSVVPEESETDKYQVTYYLMHTQTLTGTGSKKNFTLDGYPVNVSVTPLESAPEIAYTYSDGVVSFETAPGSGKEYKVTFLDTYDIVVYDGVNQRWVNNGRLNYDTSIIRDGEPALDHTWSSAKIADEMESAVVNSSVRPNILDNWYFIGGGSQQGGGIFPINQRGETSYTGSSVGATPTIYSIDRWRIEEDGVTVDTMYDVTENQVTSTIKDCIVLGVPSSVAAGAVVLSQRIKEAYIPGTKLTASIFADEVVGEFSIAVGSLGNADRRFVFDVTAAGVTAGTGGAEIGSIDDFGLMIIRKGSGASSLKIKAIKLEVGEAQSLTHKKNNQDVLNEMPDFRTEVLKCSTANVDEDDHFANRTVMGAYHFAIELGYSPGSTTIGNLWSRMPEGSLMTCPEHEIHLDSRPVPNGTLYIYKGIGSVVNTVVDENLVTTVLPPEGIILFYGDDGTGHGETIYRMAVYDGVPTGEWVNISQTSYSPVQPVASDAGTRAITPADIGKTLCEAEAANPADLVYTLPQAVSAQMPLGAEISIVKMFWSGSVTLNCSGLRVAAFGETSWIESPVFDLASTAHIVGLKKIAEGVFEEGSWTTGDGWIITGNVEVASSGV